MYFLFDFDDVMNTKIRGNTSLSRFIEVMTIRKEKKITFEKAAFKIGENPLYLVDEACKYIPPNKYFLTILKLLKSKKQTVGIASNNSMYVIDHWLQMYKLDDFLDLMFTPENVDWNWKPGTHFYLAIMKILNVLPDDIVFFDDDMDNIVVANKLGINGHKYNGGPFKEVTKYL